MLRNLKEENRAGLLYAIDANGEIVSAENANPGERYRCPVCNCEMHVCRTPSGKHIFARNPGKHHTDGKCISYESKSIKHTFDTLNPEKFIESLCRVSSKNGNQNVTKPRNTNDSTPGSSDLDEDIKISSFSSLRQINEELDYLDGSITHANHKISDFVLTFKSAPQVFQGSNYELGARIIYCRYIGFDSDRNALFFDSFNYSFTVRFCLLFPKKSEFIAYRKKFGDFCEAENGATRFIKKHEVQDVLIACDDWHFIDRQSCNSYYVCRKADCSKCYGMYQAIFTNSKQLYLIPADH